MPFTRLSRQHLGLVPDDPKRDAKTKQTGGEGGGVGGAVALDTVVAASLAVRLDDGVGVEDAAIEEIEDVARDDGGEGHEAPVLA